MTHEDNRRPERLALEAATLSGDDKAIVSRLTDNNSELSGYVDAGLAELRPSGRGAIVALICKVCGTPTSPWTCSCGETRGEVTT